MKNVSSILILILVVASSIIWFALFSSSSQNKTVVNTKELSSTVTPIVSAQVQSAPVTTLLPLSSSRHIDDESQAINNIQRQLTAIESSFPDRKLVQKYSKVTNFLHKVTGRNNNNSKTAPRQNGELTLPVPACQSSQSQVDMIIPYSEFCAPNIGQRGWSSSSAESGSSSSAKVFPINYGMPRELFVTTTTTTVSSSEDNLASKKTRDCSSILPRVQNSKKTEKTNKFKNQRDYYEQYQSSYYCIVHKKGGWDSLRIYEIISQGCFPYFLDLEFSPQYSLYHLPKKLLIEGRDLPGVNFDCSSISIDIDHNIFPKERYVRLLDELMKYANENLTTKAMGRYLLEDVLKTKSTRDRNNNTLKILYLQKRVKSAPQKGRGSYNSWLLLHGLRDYFSSSASFSSSKVVDPEPVKFLYKDYLNAYERSLDQLYGHGFSYSFLMSDNDDEVKKMRRGVELELSRKYNRNSNNNHHHPTLQQFDIVIYADPSSLGQADGRLKFLNDHFFLNETKFPNLKHIVLLHTSDVPMPSKYAANFDWRKIYKNSRSSSSSSSITILQREIPDCKYSLNAYHHHHREDVGISTRSKKAELMKKCLYYQTKNCNDDIALLGMDENRWGEFVF